jgi:hypothetical protein
MENPQEEYEKYESQIIDIDEIEGTDIKINPAYYMHTALVGSQRALANTDLIVGMIQFINIIEDLEGILISNKLIPADYDTQIAEYKKKEEVTKLKDSTQQLFKIAIFKKRLLQAAIYSNVTLTMPMKA